METFKIKLDSDSELHLSRAKTQELIKYLEMDEIMDVISDHNKIDQLIDRLCMDAPDRVSRLLHEFFNSRSDANLYLEASEQESVESDFADWCETRHLS